MSVRTNGLVCRIASAGIGNSSSRSCRWLAVMAGAVLALSVSLMQPARAALVHGDFIGTSVSYIGVEEDSSTGDPLPLFGRPTVIGPAPPPGNPCVACVIPGNSLDFSPVNFSASSANGAGADQTDGRLSFMVVAHPGKAIKSISLSEAGDTSLLGIPGFADAFTKVTATGTLNINEVDGNGIALAPIRDGFCTDPIEYSDRCRLVAERRRWRWIHVQYPMGGQRAAGHRSVAGCGECGF
jgi:hypothetical protein